MKVRVLGRHVEHQNVMLISHVCQIAIGVDAMLEARIVRAKVMMKFFVATEILRTLWSVQWT